MAAFAYAAMESLPSWLSKAVAVMRGCDESNEALTIVEETPNKSSASLGAAERFAQSLSGIVRTLREDLHERQGIELRANSLAFPFLVAHGAFVYNRYQIRGSGLTPWEEIHARPYREPIFHFGQAVLVRRPTACLLYTSDAADE